MDGIINENQLTFGKEYELDKPFIPKSDSVIDNCYRGCHKKYFHTFDININTILNLQRSLIMK